MLVCLTYKIAFFTGGSIITIIVIIPSAPIYAALYANEYNTALLKNYCVYTAKNIQPDKNEKKNLPAIPAI